MSALGKVAKYELRRQLGRGAMGIVYEAFDTVIERRVALKLLRTDQFAEELLPEVRARFKREAHSAGRLSHPNIVTVFDYGEHEGMPYLVMDLMEGEELAKSLDQGQRMAVPQVLKVMEQLLAALGYAHERGVVHRDIKPQNMFVLRDGTVKVVDFGLARIESSNLTETGAVLGTPSYMSPEQFLGLPVDARSDLFSCGVILYQLLTGDRPFSGAPSTIMQKVLRQDPVEPSVLNPTLSAAWDALVHKALAKKPDERIASAQQFLEYMRLAAEGKPMPAAAAASSDATVVMPSNPPAAQPAPAAAPAPAPRPAPKGRHGLLFGGIAAVVVAAVAVAVAVLNRPAPPAPAPVAEVKKPVVAEEKKPAPVVEEKKAAPPPAAVVEAPKPAPKPKPVAKVEKPAPAPAPGPAAPAKVSPAPAPPVATVAPAPKPAAVAAAPAPAPKPEPAPQRGKVVSLDRTWGFMVIDTPDARSLKVGDRLVAHLGDGRRIPVVVRRISGNLVSATPEGQKISDEMLGAAVTPN